MPLKTDPDLGINSWLEDELYQQYLNDRTAVDESWKHVFEDAPNGQTELAPSNHSPQSLLRTFRISGISLGVIAPPIRCPLPDVSGKVVNTLRRGQRIGDRKS